VLRRYTAWIERHRWAVIAGSIAFAVVTGLVAMRISIRADFSYLLPQSARSVKDLRAIEKRARVIGTAMVAIESDHPESRRRAAVLARERIEALGPEWVASVTFDDRVKRQYTWDHRWLLAPLPDLEAARDALRASSSRRSCGPTRCTCRSTTSPRSRRPRPRTSRRSSRMPSAPRTTPASS